MGIEKRKPPGESEEYEDKPDEDHCSEQHSYQDEGGPSILHGKELKRRIEAKSKSKGKGKFDGACYNCGKTGHRSRDWWSHHSHSGYSGGSKFVNVCDSQSFAPQPQPVYQNPDKGNRLMTTSWNGNAGNFRETGNFGGLNLICLNTNKFEGPAEEDNR